MPSASFANLPNVLLRKVCENLWWVEVKAVQLTSRACRDKLIGCKHLLNVSSILRQQLVQVTGSVVRADMFLHHLRASGNQVTGSFVLQAMFGGLACPWGHTVGDIDVLVFSQTPTPSMWGELIGYVVPGGEHEQEPAHALLAWYECEKLKRFFDADTGQGVYGIIAPPTFPLGPYKPFHIPVSFTHVGCETGRNAVDAKLKLEPFQYTSLANFVAREADFAFTAVGGTCASRACKRASPFPPFTPQVNYRLLEQP
jgi:hypothetical protein